MTPKKILNLSKYVEKILLNENGMENKCEFCKYSKLNYKKETLNINIRQFFLEKCKYCKHNIAMVLMPFGKQYITNNFKPLYEWEAKEKKDD